MNIDQAVRKASAFLEEYLYAQKGFSPTGDLADFRLEFEESYPGEGDVLVLVFAMRSEEDPENPSPEVHALARQCCDALVDAVPDVNELKIEYEFIA